MGKRRVGSYDSAQESWLSSLRPVSSQPVGDRHLDSVVRVSSSLMVVGESARHRPEA